ncbi:MAG TPA: amidohydrolase family protein [Micromonosporaceae bacterium]|nr:amidohydrolase family protein [Micromonosporaceae bacterium]
MRLPYPVYSSDSHVIEPADLWTTRMDARWRDLAPRVVALEDTDIWVVDRDIRLAVVGIQDQAGFRFEGPGKISKKARMDALRHGAAGWTPDLYMEGLAEDGVSGALLYPSTAVQAYRCVEGPLLAALARTYNDWIVEFCAADPQRLKAVAMITVDDPVDGVAEMHRMAGLGAAALMLPVFPKYPTTYDQPEYEPVWAAAADIGLPIVFHLGSNQRGRHGEPPLDLIVHATKDVHIQRSVGILVLSGLFGRYPRLRVGAIEFGASWAAPLMRRLDTLYARHHRLLDYRFPDGESPSDQFRRAVFLGFQDDRACIPIRHHLGVENLQWGNDFPHAESTYPRSHEFLAAHFAGVPDDEAAAIAGGNAIAMYGFAVESVGVGGGRPAGTP